MNKIVFSLGIIFLLTSCKKEEEVKELKKTEEIRMDKQRITLVFPDTVYINKSYNGRIDYENDLDTITTSFNDVKKYRFVDYYFLITKKTNYSVEYLKKIVKDTAYADNNRIIPLYNIKFNKLGLNYFDGIIMDEVNISHGTKGKNGEPMDRIITNEIRLTRGVYVIEKP